MNIYFHTSLSSQLPQLPDYTITPFCKSVRKMENGGTTVLREQSPHSYDKKH